MKKLALCLFALSLSFWAAEAHADPMKEPKGLSKSPPQELKKGDQVFEEDDTVSWHGVKSCNSDDRIKNELGSRVESYKETQIKAHPGLKYVDSGYKWLSGDFEFKQPIGGKRSCKASVRIHKWVILGI